MATGKSNVRKWPLSRQNSSLFESLNKQLLDEVFVISRIIEVEVGVIKAEADNPYRDLDYSGYHKNRI